MGTLVEDLSRHRQLIETHISWVFLDGECVFKVKKPVDFGFLDFRLLEQRREACEREVELNRRLSSGVYLGVLPIVVNEDGVHRIGSEDETHHLSTIVDYAVHMIQLSDTERLDVLLASKKVSSTTVSQLALQLAEFHRQAPTDEAIASHGRLAQVQANVLENFAQTREHILEFISEVHARELEQQQLDFLSNNASLFDERVRCNRVRDGHGDLRLEHVYTTHTAFQILDCIEFNDRFRYADVCADIAFLTMDLRHHDAADLAEELLAAYAQATGDYDLYALVDFYESYRALVRAKIQSFMVADPQASHELKKRAQAEARRFYLQALLAERAPLEPKCVVGVGGLIASGKSHTSSLLSKKLHCPVVDTDRTRKQLFGSDIWEPQAEESFGGMYSESATERVYAEVCRRAHVVLNSGRSVIVDASFRTRRQRALLLELCQEAGTPLFFVECCAPEATIRARLEQRATKPSISDGRTAIFEDFARTYEPSIELTDTQRLVLDTTLDDQTQGELLERFLYRV